MFWLNHQNNVTNLSRVLLCFVFFVWSISCFCFCVAVDQDIDPEIKRNKNPNIIYRRFSLFSQIYRMFVLCLFSFRVWKGKCCLYHHQIMNRSGQTVSIVRWTKKSLSVRIWETSPNNQYMRNTWKFFPFHFNRKILSD